MDKASADGLVSKLGMGVHLERLLDSDEAYQRFEKAIEIALNRNPSGTFVSIRVFYKYRHSKKIPPFIFVPNPEKPSVYSRRAILGHTYKKAVRMFSKYYGIGAEQETLDEISTQFGISRPSAEEYIGFVAMRLAQRHKQEIWYGTLG